MSLVVMDFSRIYSRDDFSGCESLTWIDCTSISATHCFCDDEAQAGIKRLIAYYPPQGIHFIDSGNYHYVSKFWNEKVEEPYHLVLFDHHPDMQVPRFEGLLSCGSWVRALMQTHRWLQKVYIVGASDELRAEAEGYDDRLVYFSQTEVADNTALPFGFGGAKTYISIDLDVLAANEVSTNWDQGTMHLEQLKCLLASVFSQSTVIGVDVCGGDNGLSDSAVRQNGRVNKDLYGFIAGLMKKEI